MRNLEDAFPPSSEAQALRRVLMRIAEALQCPVSDLFGSEPATAFSDVAELVRLWHATTDRQGKEHILAVARREADRSGAGEIRRFPAP